MEGLGRAVRSKMNPWMPFAPKEERKKKGTQESREMRNSGHEKALPKVEYCFVLYKNFSDLNKTRVQRDDEMTQVEQKTWKIKELSDVQNSTVSGLWNKSERSLMNISKHMKEGLELVVLIRGEQRYWGVGG